MTVGLAEDALGKFARIWAPIFPGADVDVTYDVRALGVQRGNGSGFGIEAVNVVRGRLYVGVEFTSAVLNRKGRPSCRNPRACRSMPLAGERRRNGASDWRRSPGQTAAAARREDQGNGRNDSERASGDRHGDALFCFDMPKRIALLLLLVQGGCANETPYATTVGVLPPGETLTVRVANATVSAFQPAAGQPRNRFAIAATAVAKTSPPPAPRLRAIPGRGVTVEAVGPLAGLLVRVPDGVTLIVDSRQGDVHVTDISGNARIVAMQGDVQAMLPGYAEARAGRGNVTVTMGSIGWPGTLHFSSGEGNVEVWINERAAFNVHLHTDRGTLFTDFNLRGTSQGVSETIDGSVNGGGSHGIDIETSAGTIRLLRLHPQA
jgi:hypothetical protein